MNCTLCGAASNDIFAATRSGWDWFTGYLYERFVACPDCQKDRPLDVDHSRKLSQVERPLRKRVPPVHPSKKIWVPF